MAQKLLKHELVERLLKLKEKQDELTVQMQCLSQEINALAQPYMPKEPKPQPLITMRLFGLAFSFNRLSTRSFFLFLGRGAE